MTLGETASESKSAPLIFIGTFILSALWSAACYLAAGPTLAVFWGGFFGVTLFSPAAALAGEKMGGKLQQSFYASLGAVCGAAAVWLLAVLKSDDTLAQWAQLAVLLAAYALAISGIAMLSRRAGMAESFALGVAILIGLAWLGWPVWLSPEIARFGLDRAAQPLIDLNPPLTANGVLRAEPPWTERTIAYQLTNLNQDVPIQLPANAAKCIALCIVIGAAGWGLGGRRTEAQS